MNTSDKAAFCSLVSVLLAEPKSDTIALLGQSDVRHWLNTCADRWTDQALQIDVLFEQARKSDGLTDLQSAYKRLFGPQNAQAVSLVESTYKPWAKDADCAMVFASATGLLMGDSAVHMNDLYRQAAIDVPGEFRSMPDHIVLQMEFLSMLYETGSDEKASHFMELHLDWIPMLKDRLKQAHSHPFYLCAVGLLDVFINDESDAGKGRNHGTTKLH